MRLSRKNPFPLADTTVLRGGCGAAEVAGVILAQGGYEVSFCRCSSGTAALPHKMDVMGV